MISVIIIMVGIWWYLNQDQKSDELTLEISNLDYRLRKLEDKEKHGKENS